MEPGVIDFLSYEQFFAKLFNLIYEFPANNVVHDIVLKFFIIVCQQVEDVVCEIFLDCDLLNKIGSIWKTFCANRSKNEFSKSNSSARVINDSGELVYWSFFGHVGILTNLICEIMNDKPGLKEITEVSDIWKLHVEPNLDMYNMMMIDVTTF